MIIKTTYKSHFNFKKNFLKKNKKKQIFSKNVVIFILFSKIFFLNYRLSISYNNKKVNKFNLLKAPSRHKKFFHQLFIEYFCIKFVWFFYENNNTVMVYNSTSCLNIFKKINLIFSKIGTNTLTRVKFKLILQNVRLKQVV